MKRALRCQPEGLQPELALAALLDLAIESTIARIERLAITNSGCNAHVFHYVRHSKIAIHSAE